MGTYLATVGNNWLSKSLIYIVCYLKIFFSGTTRFTVLYNESLQNDCLTRIACKTVFKSLLNGTLFQTTSVSNCRAPSPNIGWFSQRQLLLNVRKSMAKKIKTNNFNEHIIRIVKLVVKRNIAKNKKTVLINITT